MKKQSGVVPIAVIVIIALSMLTGGLASFLVFGKTGLASVSLGLVLGIIIAPTLMKFTKKWIDRYEKR